MPDPAAPSGSPSWGRVPTRAPDDPDGLGLPSLLDGLRFVPRAVGRHRALALGAFLAMTALAVLIVRIIPHQYQVEASVLAQRSPEMAAVSNPNLNRDWDTPTRAAREVVVRRENLVALVERTHLVERYLANRAPAIRARDWLVERLSGKPRDRARLEDGLVDTLAERLWISATPEGAVTITFQWPDREVARQIVQEALQTFLDERYASEIKTIGEATAVLRAHDAGLQQEIAATLDRVEQKELALGLRARRPGLAPGPVASPPHDPPPDEERARLESLLAARRRAIADLEAFRQQRLVELETQLARERTIYAPHHPTLMGTIQAVESLSSPSPQIGALRKEAEALERQLAARGRLPGASAAAGADLAAAMPPTLDDVRLRLRETDDPRLAYERRRLDDLLRQHAGLVERIDAASVEMDTARAAFKYRYSVIAPPRLPRDPIRPYELLAALGGVLGGLALACFAAVAADLAGGRVVERWQVERTLALPVIGELPR